jgi:uncharacterized protein YjdB
MVPKAVSSVRISFALLILVVATLSVSSQAQNPVGYWKFDDGFGTSASDSSGNGHTGTLVNGVRWVPGKLGDAVSARAQRSQYVSIPPIDLSGTQAATVTLWTKRTYSTGGGHVLFEATTNYNNSTTGFAFFPDDATCQGIQAAVHGNVGYVANCYGQPSSGVWHHIAVVFDKTQTGGDQVKYYLDGVFQPVAWNIFADTNTNYFGNNPIFLFSRGGTQEFNNGLIDDLRLYDSALTAAQILQIYNGATLTSITVTPSNPSIAVGGYQQFTATGNYSDGSHQDLTTTATWSSSYPAVATINTTGLATGVSAGNTTIAATYGSIYGSTGLTVTGSPILVSIAVTPVNPSIAVGGHQQFTATGTYSDGSHQDLTTTATWSSSSPAVATINTTGLATGISAGSTTITATYGSIHGSTGLTVTGSPVLVSIAVTPVNPSIVAGTQQQFDAMGTYSDGSHRDLTTTATWTSSNPSVATINSTGLATGVSAGTTTIQAASAGIYGSTSLTVTPDPPHWVGLAWTASTSPVVGYNAYRSTTSGGPYTKLNSSLISGTSYDDQTVQSGTTYYYVTTAVNSLGLESVYSNEAAATVP